MAVGVGANHVVAFVAEYNFRNSVAVDVRHGGGLVDLLERRRYPERLPVAASRAFTPCVFPW